MFELFETKYYQKTKKKFFDSKPTLLDKYKKIIGFLINDPLHPSLKIHKINLKKQANIYSISLDKSYRVLLEWDRTNKPNEIILLDIGDHGAVY